MQKRYLAQIIATDNEGLQMISACTTGAKVKVSNIKYLSSNKVFLLSIERTKIETDQKNKNYIIEGITLNSVQDYVIGFDKPSDISNFIFMSNFFPGTLISILSIELKNINDEVIKVPFSKIFMSLENSFIINDQNLQKIFVNSYDDEKISFKFYDEFKDISQIKLKMNLSKANITNLPNC